MRCSEIEPNAEAHLPRSHGARRHEELVNEGLSLCWGCGRSKGVEVDELAPEAEHRRVQDIVKLNDPAHAHLFVQLEFTRDVQIKNELAWAAARVPRQVSCLSDCR